MNDIELRLLEEFNKLQAFALKSSVDKRTFWSEWQALFTKVKLQQIAVKILLADLKGVNDEAVAILERKQKVLKELEGYLKELKDIALQVKGYSIFATEESGEEDDDIDDLFF